MHVLQLKLTLCTFPFFEILNRRENIWENEFEVVIK
jgi:hypothetical protein